MHITIKNGPMVPILGSNRSKFASVSKNAITFFKRLRRLLVIGSLVEAGIFGLYIYGPQRVKHETNFLEDCMKASE